MSKSSGSFGNDAAMSLRVGLHYKREGRCGIRQSLALRCWRRLSFLAIFIRGAQSWPGNSSIVRVIDANLAEQKYTLILSS